jgi:hypothetical protein
MDAGSTGFGRCGGAGQGLLCEFSANICLQFEVWVLQPELSRLSSRSFRAFEKKGFAGVG